MLRVVFAEDNYLVREGTVALLSSVDDVEVVGTAEAYDELLAAVETHAPTRCSPTSACRPPVPTKGIRAAKAIRADHPDVGVVVLSQFADEEYAYDLLKDGAEGLGYLLKERVADVDEVVRALNEVARGGSVLDPKVVEALVAAKDRMAHSALATLTDREREVLWAHGPRQEQRRDRRLALPHRAGGREAHQLAVPQARTSPRSPPCTAA